MSAICRGYVLAGGRRNNKENNRSNNPNKSGAVTLSAIFLKEFDRVLSKYRRISLRWRPIASEVIFRKTQNIDFLNVCCVMKLYVFLCRSVC